MIIRVNPVINHTVRKLCVRPYPQHPKGCVNFGKYKDCPPYAPLFIDTFDMTKPIYAIVTKFNFKAHTDRMHNIHPEWTKRQVECCLYWQGSARKALNDEIKLFLANYHNYTVTTRPEAMGVDITATMKAAGIILEWPPKTVTYQVALAGVIK